MTLHLVCQASSNGNRAAAFGIDEPVDAFGLRKLAASATKFPSGSTVYCGSATQMFQTAEALGLSAQMQPLLNGQNYGRWGGLSLETVFAREPDAVAQWLSDPDAAPHGGESVTDIFARANTWLASLLNSPGKVIGVSDSSFIRAAIVCALGAPPHAFWRIDIAPLSLTRLSGEGGRWNLQRLNEPSGAAEWPGDSGSAT